MEQQLSDLKNELTTERATISSLREEHLRSMEQLQAENVQLREGLAKVLTSHILHMVGLLIIRNVELT